MRCLHPLSALALLVAAAPVAAQEPEPLVVCATTPNLAALTREVAAGEPVDITVFAKPSQDPHYLRALPSFVRDLHRADLLVVVGLELEVAWVPALIEQARNPRILVGATGYFDASAAIRPLQVPDAPTDRSQGDVHPYGNPHFLIDPVSGIAVADALAERLGALRPAGRDRFQQNAAALRARLGGALFGAELAKTYDFTKLVTLCRSGKLEGFLESQGDLEALGGAFAPFVRHRGAKVIADHDAWPYLTRTLDLDVVGFLEPKPGIQPTTAHLRALVDRVRADDVRVLLHVPYFDARSIAFVTEAAGVTPVSLAHQVGALPDVDDYVATVTENLRRIAAALDGGRGSGG